MLGEMLLDLVLRDLRCEQNAPARRRAGHLADRDIGRAGERRGLIHRSASTICEHKTAIAAVARDAIREGVGEHQAGREVTFSGRRLLCRRPLRGPAPREAARACGPRGTVAAELTPPVLEIDAVAAEP